MDAQEQSQTIKAYAYVEGTTSVFLLSPSIPLSGVCVGMRMCEAECVWSVCVCALASACVYICAGTALFVSIVWGPLSMIDIDLRSEFFSLFHSPLPLVCGVANVR